MLSKILFPVVLPGVCFKFCSIVLFIGLDDYLLHKRVNYVGLKKCGGYFSLFFVVVDVNKCHDLTVEFDLSSNTKKWVTISPWVRNTFNSLVLMLNTW